MYYYLLYYMPALISARLLTQRRARLSDYHYYVTN